MFPSNITNPIYGYSPVTLINEGIFRYGILGTSEQHNIINIDYKIKNENYQNIEDDIPKNIKELPEEIQHEYLLSFVNSKNINVIRKILKYVNCNVRDSRGQTIVYKKSIFESFNHIVKFLISEYNAEINPCIDTTFYYPILNTVKTINSINKTLLIYFINKNVNLLVSDKNNFTVIMYLAQSNHSHLINFYCGLIKTRYSLKEYLDYINCRNIYNCNVLDILAKNDRFNELKFMINEGAEISRGGKLIETKYGYKKVISIANGKYLLINHKMNLNQFYAKINKKFAVCSEWKCFLNKMKNVIDLYKMPYQSEWIIKSLGICCSEHTSHDMDSIKYFCRKYLEDSSAKIIQDCYLDYMSNKSKENVYRENAAKIIQRNWRRKKNKEILLNEMCGICFEILDTEDKCIYLRDCKHMYHMKCINQWRKHNNTCPSCRQSIDVPPFTI